MEYFTPLSLSQAEKLKKKLKGSFYLAGGTLLNWRGAPKAKALIDLKELNLENIKTSKTKIEIGACVTIQDLALSKKVPETIAEAASNFTGINVRNMATVGGAVAGS
ncbi:MAG: FAD binding domain-containing protein, partial [Elusimicrobiota bacterium]|nr:FAD binding domain-containing protein [Elusimicrobiota bacterium]